jgi:prepilin-type N-terminal cleavage/methylation domain-containing protein
MERGFSLIEVLIGAGIIAVVVATVVAAGTWSAKATTADPLPRDASLVAAQDVAVRVRAAVAFDAGAGAAIEQGPATSWNDGPVSISGTPGTGSIDLAATLAGTNVRLRAPLHVDAVPQGALLATDGTALTP